MLKNLPANAGHIEAQARSLVQEGPLEESKATQSGILSWQSPWTEEPGGLQSMGLQSDRT